MNNVELKVLALKQRGEALDNVKFPEGWNINIMQIKVLLEGSAQLYVNPNPKQATYGVVFYIKQPVMGGKVVAVPLMNRYGDFGLRKEYTFNEGTLKPVAIASVKGKVGQICTGSRCGITHSGSLLTIDRLNPNMGGVRVTILKHTDGRKVGENYGISIRAYMPLLLTPEQIKDGIDGYKELYQEARQKGQVGAVGDRGMGGVAGIQPIPVAPDPIPLDEGIKMPALAAPAPAAPVPEEPKPAKAKKAVKRKLSSGDKVRISEKSEFYVDSAINPTGDVGKVVAVSDNKAKFYNLVEWSNGVTNSYSDEDLVKV